MNEKVIKWLYDIKSAIDEIFFFFESKEKSFSHYKTDLILKRAIERNLEIIGEALNRILKEYPEIQISYAKRIIGLRNQIIHGYDSISDENVWGIIINHLPRLKEEIDNLISQNDYYNTIT